MADSVGEPHEMLGWLDISVFVVMLAVSTLIGVYFAYFSKGGNLSAADYLVGGRTMSVVPIALSLVASYISGITMLGYPAEMYVYGCQITYKLIDFPLMGYTFATQMLPVFMDLQGISLYEYFVRRFDKNVRFIASILFVIGNMCWMPIVIYVPALAFEQVTRINLHVVTPVVCVVCIYYTTIGGIKAVVWTDAVQAMSMFLCVIVVIIKGTIAVGGLGVVWERNLASTRIEPPVLDIDPTTRHTIFTVMIGGYVGHLAHAGLSQSMVQRYLALSSAKKATRALWIFIGGIMVLYLTSLMAGLLIYAYHHDCDPLSIKRVRAPDQLLPMFVMETLNTVPGLPGLFIAGAFSAALSSMSTGLNSLSAVVLEDWVRGFFGWRPNEREAGWIMKGVVVVAGFITLALVFVVEKLGMVLQMSSSLGAMSTGPLFTLFIVGLFMPWVNTKGALAAAIASGSMMGVVVLGAQWSIAGGHLRFPVKPVSTDGCAVRYNLTDSQMVDLFANTTMTPPIDNSDVFFLFRISYLLYSPLSALVGVLVAGITVLLGWRNDLRDVDPRLLAPVARRLLPKDNKLMHSSPTEQALLAELQVAIEKPLENQFSAGLLDGNINDRKEEREKT